MIQAATSTETTRVCRQCGQELRFDTLGISSVCMDCCEPRIDEIAEWDLITADYIHFYEYLVGFSFPSPAFVVPKDCEWQDRLRQWLRGRKHQPSVWFRKRSTDPHLIQMRGDWKT